MITQQHFPPGWDEDRVKRRIARYDSMTEEEQVAEDEAAIIDRAGQTVITVPETLLPAIRQLLAGGEPLAVRVIRMAVDPNDTIRSLVELVRSSGIFCSFDRATSLVR